MIGGVVGDYIGSEYEHKTLRTYNLLKLTSVKSHITDESVMLAATADALIHDVDFARCYLKWGRHFSNVEFGPGTSFWLEQGDVDYCHESYGNGAAARAGIIGMLDLGLFEILDLAAKSARCTHNSEEGINGAKAMAYTVFAMRSGYKKETVYNYLLKEYGYLMYYDYEQLKTDLTYSSSAEITVPVSIFLALESKNWNDCIRKCLYCAGGGDTDSIMSMASLIKSQSHPIDKKYLNQTKRWLFQHAQPILQMAREFEVKRALCKLPF
ncbi:ADP-ribosylglycohydrolase family protein [Thalassotalea sp. SU-HH00458]|uniref:ADP-ribosylglycohydrolase family protein n=1 Tax=Thalassotalea sp. SU-HH00458 TaxID=3127657 RepID=UPI003109F59E